MEGFIRDGVTEAQSLVDRALRYGGDAHFFDDSNVTSEKVKDYLDSMDELEKLTGMKWLLAMLSKGQDVSGLFSSVVKNVHVKSVELKKMVYNYLVHYADFNSSCREMALLSINSFQKDMTGGNQFIRGLALRVLTSIRVAEITQIQLNAVQKCAKDSSAYVRKCAATALTKIYAFDPSQLSHLTQILQLLLDDQSTMVLGSALATFNEICPREYHLLHENYRTICHLLADLDEWSQIIALEVLIRYTRNQFVDPVPGLKTAVRLQSKLRSSSAMLMQEKQLIQERQARNEGDGDGRSRAGTAIGGGGRGAIARRRLVRKAFYSDEEDVSDEEEFFVNEPEKASAAKPFNLSNDSSNNNNTDSANNDKDRSSNLDIDHNLVLNSAMPLLKSRNCGVVLNVCTLQYYCGAQIASVTAKVAKALVRILRNYREIQYVVLNTIAAMARDIPTAFEPFLSEFFVKSTDPTFNKLLKLDIITLICSKKNCSAVLRELQVYIKQQSNVQLVCASIRAVGKVADCDPSSSMLCMDGLLQVVAYSIQSGAIRYSSLGAGGAGGSNSGTTGLTSDQPTDMIISEAITVLRHLIQQNSQQQCASRILLYLTKLLISDEGSIDVPSGRASIVWLIGEFHELVGKVAPDVLRILANSFAEEATETKNQILNFAVKLSLRFPNDATIEKLMTYVLEMSRYDTDVDFRDRSRLVTALLGLSSSDGAEGEGKETEKSLEKLAQIANGIFLAKKMPPTTLLGAVDTEGLLHFNIGSLSSLVGHTVNGYEPIPDWQEEQPDLAVRDRKTATVMADEYSAKGKGSSSADNLYSSSDDDDNSNIHANRSRKSLSSSASSSSSSSASSSSSDESSSYSGSSSDDSNRKTSRSKQRGKSNISNADSSSDSDSDGNQDFVSRPRSSQNSTRKYVNTSGINTTNNANNNSNIKASIRSSGGIGVKNSKNNSSLDASDQANTHRNIAQVSSSNPDILDPESSKTLSMNGGKKSSSITSNFDVFDDIMTFPNNNSSNNDNSNGNSSKSAPESIINMNNNVFMGLHSSSSSAISSKSNIATTVPTSSSSGGELLSPLKFVIRPELSRGLSFGVGIRLAVRPSLAYDAVSAMLVFKNCRDSPIRKIRLIFPADLKRTHVEDIAVLNPNEERHIPIEMVVTADKNKSYRIDLSSDAGSFSGSLSFYSFELFYPSVVTLIEFNSIRQSLTRNSAMGECAKTIPIGSIGGLPSSSSDGEPTYSGRLVAEVLRRLQRLVNGHLVQTPAGDGSTDIMLSSASRRKGLAVEERLLLTARVTSSNVLIKAISEDSVLDVTILDVLKTQLCNESLFTK